MQQFKVGDCVLEDFGDTNVKSLKVVIGVSIFIKDGGAIRME